MWQVGVWEPEEPVSPLLAALAREADCLIRACCAPHPTWNTPLDLLVVAPHGPRAVCLPPCRAALVPGDVAPPTCAAPPPIWVSYGCASCNTLTLSSLTGHSAAVAVQREFPHLGNCGTSGAGAPLFRPRSAAFFGPGGDGAAIGSAALRGGAFFLPGFTSPKSCDIIFSIRLELILPWKNW